MFVCVPFEFCLTFAGGAGFDADGDLLVCYLIAALFVGFACFVLDVGIEYWLL